MTASFTIALVDDHEIVSIAFREAFRQVESVTVLGTASTVDSLLEQHPHPDLVVLDLRLADGTQPDRNVEVLREAGAEVLAYTAGDDPHLIRLAARAGVVAVLRKSQPLAALVETVEHLARGEVVVSTDWAAAIDGDPELSDAALSPREEQVLALYASGLKTHSVAHQTGISADTVEDYVRRIRAKYARAGRPAPTKVDLYKRAIEDGLLPAPRG
ncbi:MULTISPECIES: response regulator transcription factor [unclassified Diaminobutyricimonas]|uniref:response regulator transcription factor n=1 Tax=unclassified Diaminobutyricimonas TaxID=2643261 RepID=UPI0012F485C7|nr:MULTISPECIES: response regulator transcription factor [unclassified Diaminobutyricimonas]